jgi:hypothetical protein
MLFSDHALSCRLEPAEGYACRKFAMARRRLFPESRSEAIRAADAEVVFDGPDSPITRMFGLGLFEPPASEDLEEIEEFFRNPRRTDAAQNQPIRRGHHCATAMCSRISSYRGQSCFVPAD